MKFKYLFVFVIISSMMVGCQSKEEQWRNPNACDFINESKCIKVNYEFRYDIIPRITHGLNTAKKSDIGIEMEIFNYGGMLRINKNAIENIYSSAFAPRSHFYVVLSENISIINTFNDGTFGEWAKGRIVVPDFDLFLEDVFISPLAYNYMHEKQDEDNDCLVLVRLISPSENRTFNGIFYGDYLTKLFISSNYQYIVTHSAMSFNTNNCGEFWKPLLTDEEYNIYKSYLRMLQMGLVPNSYELPKTIMKKIAR